MTLPSCRSCPIVVTAVALALLAGGCFGGSSQTKAGVGTSHQLTLRMQSPDSVDPDAQYFVNQVKARTHGRIRIVIDGDTYTSSFPDNEVRLVRDLRRGKVALAYLPSRAWVRDGLPGFQALQAPFLVTDYELLRRITTGPIARTMLSSLDSAGLVGLGLVPKELRRPLGRRPLTSPAAFRGARIRVPTSPTSVLALRALGAVPRTNFSSQGALHAMTAHRLDGVESDAHAMYDNGYVHIAPYLPSNLTLFAKTETLVITRTAFDGLPAADRAALRAAAAATVAHANPAAVERSEIALLCDDGLRLVRASAADLAALHREALRVYATLGRDPTTRRAIAAIERLAGNETPAAATLQPCRPVEPVPTSSGTNRFPEGTFETTITKADFLRQHVTLAFMAGFPNPLKVTIRDGRWRTNDVIPNGGRYIVHGDEVTFVYDEPVENRGERETLKWTYYRGELSFRIVSVADTGARAIYVSHPWRRVGS
jgi:TRAP-type C4-dicarboxylate transport system substrate-binding protein